MSKSQPPIRVKQPSRPLLLVRLIRKLETIADISDDAVQAILELPTVVKDIPAGADLSRDGDRPTQCCVLLDGMMHRYKGLPHGERQVLSYHLPGDMPDLLSLHLSKLDHSLGAVISSRVAMIPHAAVRDLVGLHPDIAVAFWRDTLIDAAVFREWIVNVGSRDAPARIGHLICELFVRLKVLGLAKGDGFTLPLTQVELADATGMSSVHVNRTLQTLRGAGLIALRNQFLRILDWPKLQAESGFDPAYLHLKASDEPPSTQAG